VRFPNVKAEMARNGVTIEELAKEMGISPTTLSNKLNGHYDLWLNECHQIRAYINENGGEFMLDDLFPARGRVAKQ